MAYESDDVLLVSFVRMEGGKGEGVRISEEYREVIVCMIPWGIARAFSHVFSLSHGSAEVGLYCSFL